jgi:hypothetical protein
MGREIGNSQNLERLAGELYHTPLGESGQINFGNVVMFQQDASTDSVSGFFHPRSGTQREVRKDLKDSSLKFTVKGNERTQEIDAMLLLAKVGDAFTQNAVTEDATVDLVVAKRRTFDVGKMKLVGVSAAVGATAKIKGVRENGEIVPANADYVVDHLLGKIYIPEGSTIADAATLTVTYQCGAVAGRKLKEIGMHVLRRGSFELVGFSGTEEVRKQFKFDGQITPKSQGENSVENFNEFEFEITAIGDVAVNILS